MPATQISTLPFIYGLFGESGFDKLNYIYKGNFSQSLTNSILGMAESNLATHQETSPIKKKVYFIMVESLQNITRHQSQDDAPGFFIIQRQGSDYFVTSCNTIGSDNIAELTEKLKTVNSLDQDSLKTYYKEMLSTGAISDKGGAGLGLIEMARKSGNKLLYDFEKINDTLSHFYFQTRISADKAVTAREYGEQQLNEAKGFHQMILSNNINLVYQGEFTQEVVKCVLMMTEGSIVDQELLLVRKRTFLVVVELLQNIFKHGHNPEAQREGNPGIFMMGRRGNDHLVIASNIVRNEHVPALKDKIALVNSLGQKDLDDLYRKVLMQDEKPGDKGAGLGIIDLKIKSGHNLKCDFKPISNESSIFTVEATIASPKN